MPSITLKLPYLASGWGDDGRKTVFIYICKITGRNGSAQRKTWSDTGKSRIQGWCLIIHYPAFDGWKLHRRRAD